jgi:hypothetical protein
MEKIKYPKKSYLQRTFSSINDNMLNENKLSDLNDKTGLIILHTIENITLLNGYGVFWENIGAANCSNPLKRY